MQYRINGTDYNVEINSYSGSKAEVTVNGVVYEVEIGSNDTPAPVCKPAPVAVAPAQIVSDSEEARPICSPLPGVIIGVKVNVGDTVKAGQEIAVLEAMKMENSIEAEHAGTVTAVHVSKGDSILEGAPIVTIG